MLQLDDHCHLSQVAPSSTHRDDTSASMLGVSDLRLLYVLGPSGYQPVASPVPSGTKSESFHRATPVTANAPEKR